MSAPLVSMGAALESSGMEHDLTSTDHEIALRIHHISTSPAMAAMVRSMLRSFESRHGVSLGCVDTLTEDVIAEVVLTVWQRRGAWMARTAESKRAWMFGVAKNKARQACQQVIRDYLKFSSVAGEAAAAGTQVTHADSSRYQQPVTDHARQMDALEQIRHRVITTPGMGPEGWERVRRRAMRSGPTREVIRSIVDDIAHQRHWTVRALVAPVLDPDSWAAARTSAGKTLSTVDAVTDGACAHPVQAHRYLCGWWKKHRAPSSDQVTAHHLMDAGLLDHHPPGLARITAANAAVLGMSAARG
ncbi:MAG: hypothetical protein LBH13_03275 [Cellulomonadaceae bacterium]|jgi:hypothetical protein|nr:hypothetical protein [Cellulomonadaceae bacterium]